MPQDPEIKSCPTNQNTLVFSEAAKRASLNQAPLGIDQKLSAIISGLQGASQSLGEVLSTLSGVGGLVETTELLWQLGCEINTKVTTVDTKVTTVDTKAGNIVTAVGLLNDAITEVKGDVDTLVAELIPGEPEGE